MTPIKNTVFGNDPRAIANFQKIDPTKPWGGEITIMVQASGAAVRSQSSLAVEKTGSAPLRHQPLRRYGGDQEATFRITQLVPTASDLAVVNESKSDQVECERCHAHNYVGQDFCGECGESLEEAFTMV